MNRYLDGGALSILGTSDIVTLQSNLAKLNFRVAELNNTGKYAMKNMVTDVYNDASGINASASSLYTFDATNKLVKVAPGGSSIPVMTSNTTPSGVASASGEYSTSYQAWKAFDGSLSGTYWANTSNVQTAWLQYQFPTPKVIISYEMASVDMTNNVPPKDWTFQGSNDGTTWTTLDTRTGYTTWTGGAFAPPFNITNTTAYTYYRINMTAPAATISTNGNYALYEVRMNATQTSTIVISTANASAFVPTKVLLSAEYSNGASGAVTFAISRDGGTTWITVVPDVLTDISSSPIGSSIVAKVTLTNDATCTSLGYSWY